jgi:hypothetical protein
MSTPPWNPDLEAASVEELVLELSALRTAVHEAVVAIDCAPASAYPSILPFECRP